MEDPAALLNPVVRKGGLKVDQLVLAVRGEVPHDGEKKIWLASRHGIELGVIEEGHGKEYRPRAARGKEQGTSRPGRCRGRWGHRVGL